MALGLSAVSALMAALRPLAQRRPGGGLKGVKLVCPDTAKASSEDRIQEAGCGPSQLKHMCTQENPAER